MWLSYKKNGLFVNVLLKITINRYVVKLKLVQIYKNFVAVKFSHKKNLDFKNGYYEKFLALLQSTVNSPALC